LVGVTAYLESSLRRQVTSPVTVAPRANDGFVRELSQGPRNNRRAVSIYFGSQRRRVRTGGYGAGNFLNCCSRKCCRT
jgi:hypothetical protein